MSLSFKDRLRPGGRGVIACMLVLALALVVPAPASCADGLSSLGPVLQAVVQEYGVARPEQNPPSPPAAKKFFVGTLVFEGNTVIGTEELESLTADHRGREMTLQELNVVAQAVQDYYRRKGYFLARAMVPAQEIRDGKVRILVLEGKAGEVRIEGNKYYKSSFIRRRLAPALKGGVLKEEPLQRALLLLNECGDLNAKVALTKGREDSTTDLVVKVEDKKPLHVGLDYNNFGNPFTGENRFGADVMLGNLPAQGSSIFVRGVFSTPAPTTTPFIQAGYIFPLNDLGARMTAAYASADVKMGKEYQILDIRGTAQIFSLSAALPLRRTERDSSNLFIGLSSKSIKNYFLTSVMSSSDEIRSAMLGYQADWFAGYGKNFVSVSLTQGLGTLFGGMPDRDPFASRYHADDTFGHFNLDFSRVQKVGTRDFLILRASGQLATDPLVVAEQFALGGPDSVRGFAQSEYLGDSGYTVSAELRIPVAKSNRLQLAAFLDYGSASLKEPQPGDRASRDFLGAGAGIRYTLSDQAWLRFDAGWPLSPLSNSLNHNPALYVQLQFRS